MLTRKRSIVQTLFISFSASIALMIGLFAVYLIVSVYKKADQNIEHNKRIYIENKKELIKNQVNLTLDLIYFERRQYEKTETKTLAELQKEILTQVGKIRFQDDGYIFVVTYDGTTLMNDVQRFTIGGNQWEITDPNGVKIIQEERKAAEKPEGDFIYYSWFKPNAEKPTPKISFVRGIPDWRWMVGTGIYLEDVENIIQKEQASSQQLANRYIVLIIVIFSALLLMLLAIIRYIAKKIQESFNVFSNFFEDAATKTTRIDTGKLHFSEFEKPALSANTMIDELNYVKQKLIQFNCELEILVQERTKEIQQQKEEILSQNEEIRAQRDELEIHQANLEKLVEERTIDLKRAKERAEESDRLKTAFLANMSHEIRTPLNGILGFSELIVDRIDDLHIKKEFKENIVQSCNTLTQLIDNIIDISKIQTGQMAIEIKPTCINTMLDKLHEKFSLKIDLVEKKSIQLIKTAGLENRTSTVSTDPDRLEQILTNLLDNALKFTEKGVIHFGYEVEKNKMKFFVTDTGIGLEKDQLSLLFNRFHKFDADNQKFYQGLGLGLSISKSLVELLGGEIWAESQIHQGSSFYFTIPIR